jgi:ribose 5-phosphate isomerase B
MDAVAGCRTPGLDHFFEYATHTGKRPSGKLQAMRIVVGADDEGPVADAAVDELRARGHEVIVLEREQWPDIAAKVAQAVAAGEADQGMLFCWTGTGTSMAANKVPGVRAALAWEPWIAEGARKWNDANVLVMSLKRTEPETARRIVDAWLSVEEPDPDEAANIARLAELERNAIS